MKSFNVCKLGVVCENRNLGKLILQIINQALLGLLFSHHCWHLLLQVAYDVGMDFGLPSSLHKFIDLDPPMPSHHHRSMESNHHPHS